MKRKLNVIFFSICFLAAIMAEAYSLQVLEGDLLSVAGMGMVVLIMGYLLLDSIRSVIIKFRNDAKFIFDHTYREETDIRNNRYTELSNLQKATYTAMKKNTVVLSEQLEDVLLRLEKLENSYTKEIIKIGELHKKTLEGQKNALNLEINYSKENTKQLIQVLREEVSNTEQKELLLRILEALEKGNSLLQDQKQQMENLKYIPAAEPHFDNQVAGQILFKDSGDVFSESTAQHSAETSEELYEDTLQETMEKTSEGIFQDTLNDTFKDTFEDTIENTIENTIEDTSEDTFEDTFKDTAIDTFDTFENIDKEISEGKKIDTFEEIYEESKEGSSEARTSDTTIEDSSSTTQTIAPLYDDPNKALSADEIAALFASVGQ